MFIRAASPQNNGARQYGDIHGCKWLIRAPWPRTHSSAYWLVPVRDSSTPRVLLRTPWPMVRP
jgi:hypothetical protein